MPLLDIQPSPMSLHVHAHVDAHRFVAQRRYDATVHDCRVPVHAVAYYHGAADFGHVFGGRGGGGVEADAVSNGAGGFEDLGHEAVFAGGFF